LSHYLTILHQLYLKVTNDVFVKFEKVLKKVIIALGCIDA